MRTTADFHLVRLCVNESNHLLKWFGFPATWLDQAMVRPLSNRTVTYP